MMFLEEEINEFDCELFYSKVFLSKALNSHFAVIHEIPHNGAFAG